MFAIGLIEGFNMEFGYNQNVRRRLWIEIVECNTPVIFVYRFRLYSAVGDLTKNTVFCAHTAINQLKHSLSILLIGSVAGLFIQPIFDPLDVGADGPKLPYDLLVPAVDMINTLDGRLALST